MSLAKSKKVDNRQSPAEVRKALARNRPVQKPASRRDVLVDMGNGSLPLYKSIKLEVTRALSGGEVKAGMALPTEKELSERYGVSVGTVRRALSDLVADKVLVRQQGRGTFLAPFDSGRMLNSFWHIVRKDGVREVPIVQTLRFEETSASAHAAERLGIRHGEPIYWIVNLMLMGGSPMLLDGLHIPKSLFPGLTKAQFVGRGATIYDLYRDSFGISVVKTVDQLTAVSADLETAKKLGLALGTPLLEIVRVAQTFQERPVELRRSLLYTEKYEFVDVTGGSSVL
ncbi:MAG: GntR family transcriptional regulator [Caldimonas sp.]